jgi:hypothetical protein
MYYVNDNVFIHACEAYLAGAMYTKDFSYLLMGEENKAIEEALRDYYEQRNKQDSNAKSYEDGARELAKLLHKVKLDEEYKKIDKAITEALPW